MNPQKEAFRIDGYTNGQVNSQMFVSLNWLKGLLSPVQKISLDCAVSIA